MKNVPYKDGSPSREWVDEEAPTKQEALATFDDIIAWFSSYYNPSCNVALNDQIESVRTFLNSHVHVPAEEDNCPKCGKSYSSTGNHYGAFGCRICVDCDGLPF